MVRLIGAWLVRVTAAVFGDQVVRMVADAFAGGPMTRTDLLAVAVAAQAPSLVLNALLSLPERRYDDVVDLRGELIFMTTKSGQ